MKHFVETPASLQQILRPDAQSVRIDPVLEEILFKLNGVDQVAVQVVDSHGRPVLVFERQRLLNAQPSRSVGAFRIGFHHAPALHDSLGRIIERVRDGG